MSKNGHEPTRAMKHRAERVLAKMSPTLLEIGACGDPPAAMPGGPLVWRFPCGLMISQHFLDVSDKTMRAMVKEVHQGHHAANHTRPDGGNWAIASKTPHPGARVYGCVGCTVPPKIILPGTPEGNKLLSSTDRA